MRRILEPPQGKTVYYIEGMKIGDFGIARTPFSQAEPHQIGVYEYEKDEEWREIGLFWNIKHANFFARHLKASI